MATKKTNKTEGESTCPCGQKIKFKMRKPTYFQPTFSKVNCVCGSRFILTCMKRDGTFTIAADSLHLSEKAYHATKQVVDEQVNPTLKTHAKRAGTKVVEAFDRTVAGVASTLSRKPGR